MLWYLLSDRSTMSVTMPELCRESRCLATALASLSLAYQLSSMQLDYSCIGQMVEHPDKAQGIAEEICNRITAA